MGRTVDRTWGLKSGTRIELQPLRLVDLDRDDVETLTCLHTVLAADDRDTDIDDAIQQVGEAHGLAPEDLRRDTAHLTALLNIEWDEHARDLATLIAAQSPSGDLDLTALQAATYRQIAFAIVRATGGDALDYYVTGAAE